MQQPFYKITFAKFFICKVQYLQSTWTCTSIYKRQLTIFWSKHNIDFSEIPKHKYLTRIATFCTKLTLVIFLYNYRSLVKWTTQYMLLICKVCRASRVAGCTCKALHMGMKYAPHVQTRVCVFARAWDNCFAMQYVTANGVRWLKLICFSKT